MAKITQQQFDESFNALINHAHDSSYEIHTKTVEKNGEMIVVFKKPNFLWRFVRWLIYGSYQDCKGVEKAIKFINDNLELLKSSAISSTKKLNGSKMEAPISASLQLNQVFSHLFQRMKKEQETGSINNKDSTSTKVNEFVFLSNNEKIKLHDDGKFQTGTFNENGNLQGKGIQIYRKIFHASNEIDEQKIEQSYNFLFEGIFDNGCLKKGTSTCLSACIENGEEFSTQCEEGEFDEKGKLVKGKKIDAQGFIMEGTFNEKGVLHGRATSTFPNFWTFTGLYEEGLIKNGKLTRLNVTEGIVSEEGEFDEDGKLKKGTVIYADGSVMKGEFNEEGFLDGEGNYNKADGWTYEGTFEKGILKKGKVENPESGYLMEGTYDEEGYLDGEGMQTNYKLQWKKTGIFEHGEFLDDQKINEKEASFEEEVTLENSEEPYDQDFSEDISLDKRKAFKRTTSYYPSKQKKNELEQKHTKTIPKIKIPKQMTAEEFNQVFISPRQITHCVSFPHGKTENLN